VYALPYTQFTHPVWCCYSLMAEHHVGHAQVGTTLTRGMTPAPCLRTRRRPQLARGGSWGGMQVGTLPHSSGIRYDMWPVCHVECTTALNSHQQSHVAHTCDMNMHRIMVCVIYIPGDF
jgi:hypothetical protein